MLPFLGGKCFSSKYNCRYYPTNIKPVLISACCRKKSREARAIGFFYNKKLPTVQLDYRAKSSGTAI